MKSLKFKIPVPEITMQTLYKVGLFSFTVGGVCQVALWNFSSVWSVLLGFGNIVFSFTIAGFFLTELRKFSLPKGDAQPLSEDEIKEMFKDKGVREL